MKSNFFFLSILLFVACAATFAQTKSKISEMDGKEEIGRFDTLHYLGNYLEDEIDTLTIYYLHHLCLCPRWQILETNDPIYVEYNQSDKFSNSRKDDFDSQKYKVVGQFYKYEGIPANLQNYDYEYLSGKWITNARIFKIIKEIE